MGRKRSLNFPLMTVALSAIALISPIGAEAQEASQGTPQLQTYTTPDQSAQAGLPPGWKVIKGAETVIIMTGPNGETINLGFTFVVRNAPFQLGRKSPDGLDLAMPNSASLDQKFTMLQQFGASLNNKPDPEVKIASSTPIQVPVPNVQCGRLTGTFNSMTGPVAFGMLMCSLPVDTGGTYKVMFKLAQAPPAVAAQEKALAGAVFASYKIAPAMLQRKLAPHFAPPPPMPMPSAPGIAGGGGVSAIPDPTNSECFDLVVIRETPKYRLPRKCGGTAPDE